jgi:hypothetical protein
LGQDVEAMPIGYRVTSTSPNEPTRWESLRERLTKELRAPSDTEAQPVVVFEGNVDDRHRLTVVWDDWSDLDLRQRSEMIMEAYEAAVGRPRALLVTSALGVTRIEAERMGFRYSLAPAAA